MRSSRSPNSARGWQAPPRLARTGTLPRYRGQSAHPVTNGPACFLTQDMTSARPGPAARPVGLPQRCDAVVVGGGVVGLSSAYELARRGLSVVLVESGQVGGRQSGRNLGFVRQQGRAPAELPMMMAANQRWQGLSHELGSDVEWQ